ncbi:MAG: ACT domain-containing protein, partial [Salegentibacter sp.]
DEKKEIAEEGKAVLARKLKAQKIPFNEKTVNELVVHFHLKTSLDLFYRVGIGKIDNQKLKEFASSRSNALVSYIKRKIKKPVISEDLNKDEITAKYDQLVFGKDEDETLEYKLANCCNPIPGDSVFGFVTVNEGIKVHKKDCPNAIQLQSNYAYRIIQAKWIDSSQQDFKAVLRLTGIDNLGLVSEITKEISSNLNVNMKKINFESVDGVFSGRITLIVKNNSILTKIINRLKKINGIDKVTRE